VRERCDWDNLQLPADAKGTIASRSASPASPPADYGRTRAPIQFVDGPLHGLTHEQLLQPWDARGVYVVDPGSSIARWRPAK